MNCRLATTPQMRGANALTGRIVKVGESIDSCHLVSANCPAQARMPNCEYGSRAVLRASPSACPPTTGGHAMRSLWLNRPRTGGAPTRCQPGYPAPRCEAELLVQHRPQLVSASMCSSPSGPRQGNSARTQAIPVRCSPRSTLRNLQRPAHGRTAPKPLVLSHAVARVSVSRSRSR